MKTIFLLFMLFVIASAKPALGRRDQRVVRSHQENSPKNTNYQRTVDDENPEPTDDSYEQSYEDDYDPEDDDDYTEEVQYYELPQTMVQKHHRVKCYAVPLKRKTLKNPRPIR